MHTMETIVIWGFVVNAVMLLTLLMPQLVSGPSCGGLHHDKWQAMSIQHAGEEPRKSLALVTQAPDICVVSTSWAWGTPHAPSEREATGPPQAA